MATRDPPHFMHRICNFAQIVTYLPLPIAINQVSQLDIFLSRAYIKDTENTTPVVGQESRAIGWKERRFLLLHKDVV
jgi:hypothetical protein